MGFNSAFKGLNLNFLEGKGGEKEGILSLPLCLTPGSRFAPVEI
jgi:hypothetical protein